MTEIDDLLGLVRRALDEFEDVPLGTSVRRALRIAMHRGNETEAWWAREDLRPLGGARELAQTEVRTIWPDLDEAAAQERYRPLLEAWLKERSPSTIPDLLRPHLSDDGSGSVIAGSVDELERVLVLREGVWMQQMSDLHARTVMELRIQIDQEILGRIRHRTHMYLCRCEAELTFDSTSSTIFDRHRRRVDRHLSELAPDALDKINSSYRRAHDGDSESLSQALLSCRRILLALADLVFPAQAEPILDAHGKSHSLTGPSYRNRLFAFLDQALASETTRRAVHAALGDLDARIESLDTLANKGVHDAVRQEEVDFCVVQTYLVTGEVLSLYESRREDDAS